ncbi:hypothetical protein HBI56_223410 [Parastagonospora nodorum]|uniref:Uncharacterized protein n=1 Tax=Phaeosphaeria nodorum (strain SN15 / ATCC MYA-4574 / FGSC 10173) TaxID=321614 RepID=A0A7U2EWJ7_PHANO|nr:hypothetical protein HBH56_147580 [Parastagonospora nodorum]QRC94042.1 hypothetical protein JI435_405040 [Parastagonospora nodorum SN15]KAH3923195.1 hypothetical protein HBH54_212220 [Parastagonospora nodorum]KAH3945912.1 hypothetical protein HBH53_135040 [Parastagonospora nodorum]KAH3984170.1 hypothetical protein HBH52_065000 [Parastagonospora nodorum]
MTCTGCARDRVYLRKKSKHRAYQEWLHSTTQRTAAPDLHMRPASRALQARARGVWI